MSSCGVSRPSFTLYYMSTNSFISYYLFSQAGPKSPGTFKIEGLTPKKKYKIRVKAVNKEGESDPLETDQPILAKNPYGNISNVIIFGYLIFVWVLKTVITPQKSFL